MISQSKQMLHVRMANGTVICSTVEKWAQTLIDKHGYELCDVCVYKFSCPRGVTGTPNGPSYPPCVDKDDKSWFIDRNKVQRLIEAGALEEEVKSND